MADQVLNERTNMTNEISLLMDGGETKNLNIITVLTTNHVENINPTFLRGKRIGGIVTFSHLDAKTAKLMIENYLTDENGNSMLEEDCQLAAQAMEDEKIVPAFVAEILDKVKSYLIYSGKTTISCEDILSSIKSYKRQMEIATVKKASENKGEQLIRAMHEAGLGGTNTSSSDLSGLKKVLIETFEEKGF